MIFHQPVETHFGWGCRHQIPSVVAGFGFRTLLLVAGKSALRRNGELDRLRAALNGVTLIDGPAVSANPSVVQVAELADGVRSLRFDAALAIGGGSVLDVAKSLCALAPQPGDPLTYLRGIPMEKPALPWIAIPTTAGTGSEVTCWSTVWDLEQRKKRSLSMPSMYARAALVDPELTLSVPPKITAQTGLDALSHAMEALWSKAANPVSAALAEDALRRISSSLIAACKDPANRAAREDLALGSLLAGLAFSQTRTAGVHSTSYPLTLFFNIVHGHACGLLLSPFLEFNQDAAPLAVGRIVRALGADSVPQAQEILSALLEQSGLPPTLEKAGLPGEGISVIVQNASTPGRGDNNPRALEQDALHTLLTRHWKGL